MGKFAANIDPYLAAHGTPTIAEGIVFWKIDAFFPIQRSIMVGASVAGVRHH